MNIQSCFANLGPRRSSARFTVALILTMVPPSVVGQITVSNLGEPSNLGYVTMASFQWYGMAFTTDATFPTYSLDSVTLRMAGAALYPYLDGFFVRIYSDSGTGSPGSSLEKLTGNASPNVGNYTYASTGLTLNANSTYWVVAGVESGAQYNWDGTNTNQSTVGGATWQIGDTAKVAREDGQWQWQTGSYALHFSVTATGSAVPEPGTYALLAGVSALGFAAWRRRRSSA